VFVIVNMQASGPYQSHQELWKERTVVQDFIYPTWISYLSRSLCLQTNRLNHCSYHSPIS